MKHLFLFAGLLGAASPAAAQATYPTAHPVTVLASPAPIPDTAAAIHRLFAAKRKRQGYVIGATVVAAIGTAGTVVANRPADSGTSSGFGVMAPNNLDLAMVGVVAVPVVLAEALFLGGWGYKYERQVLATWQQQHQLPRAVKRRLVPRYFQ
jgi:hypothetical protein